MAIPGPITDARETPEPAPDAAALGELYRAHSRRIFRLCLGHLRNASDAEDAVQETFLRASRCLDRLTGEPAAYLTIVARNVCLDELRRRGYRSTPSPVATLPETGASWTDADTLTRWDLRDLWGRLSEGERALLAQSFAGYSYEEIGRRSGRTMKAVSVAVARARGHARQLSAAGAWLLLLPQLVRRVLRRGAPRLGSMTNAAASLTAAGLEPAGLLAASAIAVMVIGQGGALPRDGSPLHPAPSVASAPLMLHDPSSLPSGAQVAVVEDAPASQAAVAAAARRPAGAIAGAVFPGQGAQQRDVHFESMTPSPQYSSDHTVFAAGVLAHGCARPIPCPALFQTRDAGATWQHLAAAGFQGGEILLAPSYPADRTLFASTPFGLQRSDDGGASFHLVAAATGPMAIAPDSRPGDATVLIGSLPLVLYHAGTGMVTPGPALPTGVTAPQGVGYAGDSRHMVATASRPDLANPALQDGVVVRCAAPRPCTVVDVSPDQLMLAASPAVAADHTLLAYSAGHLSVSHDSGATFTELPVASWGMIQSVGFAPDYASSHLLRVATMAGSAQASGNLLTVAVEGTQVTLAAVHALPAHTVLDELVAVPGGALLGAFAGSDPAGLYGIHCSTDSGATWRSAC